VNALEKALYTKFTADLAATFTGGWYWDTAAKGAATPFLIAQVISAPATSQYGGVTFADVTVQFRAVGTGRRSVTTLAETLCGVLDEFVPTLDSGTVCNVVRTSEPFALKLPAEEQTGADGHMAVVTYVYSVAP
jgi:hypothetical protein